LNYDDYEIDWKKIQSMKPYYIKDIVEGKMQAPMKKKEKPKKIQREEHQHKQ